MPTIEITKETNTYYVSKGGDNSRSGLSPVNALLTINEAINRVTSGGEICVLDTSTYTENLVINKNLILSGSFILNGNITINPTIEARLNLVNPILGTITNNGTIKGYFSTSQFTGWSDYVDTVYTELNPYSLAANTPTRIPNNKGTIREAQKPIDVRNFYILDSPLTTPALGKIAGINGDSYLITIDFKAKPTAANTTLLETWLDIGGAIGELYRRSYSFPKGVGIERSIGSTTAVYTLDTWQSNGADILVEANGTCDIYDIRFVVFRVHKAN